MLKKKKCLLLFTLPFLVSCGENPNVSSSEIISSPDSLASSEENKDLFSSFLEKCQSNIGVFEIHSSGFDFPISTYSFYGEKVQFQQYSEDFKDYYFSSYNSELLDGGILINGEQGAFSYRIENNQVELESPVGYASNLIDLKSYGPALLGDMSLYEASDTPNQYTSKVKKDGSLKVAPYWTAVAGISSSYEKYMDSFTLKLDQNLENIEAILHFQVDNNEMTYTVKLTHLGDKNLLIPDVLSSYLSSPKMVSIPSSWTEESQAYINSNKPLKDLLPFPRGVTAQYVEETSYDSINIINYGVNLIPTYKEQLLAAGFVSQIALNSTYVLELSPKEGDRSFLSSKATVLMKYTSNATVISISLDTDYQDFSEANEELSLWNKGTYNSEYSLDLKYAAIPDSSKVTRVHSYNMTSTLKERLASSGYSNDVLYYWLAEVDISSKEDAISFANEVFLSQKNNGFFLDEKTTLEKDGYVYVFKVNSKQRTEAVLRIVLDRDDMGEYSGTMVFQALVGNYVFLDSMLKESPYEG